MSVLFSKPWWILAVVGSWLAACGGLEAQPPDTAGTARDVGQTEQRLVTLVSCPIGTSTTLYSPPLTRTPQDVTVTPSTQWSNCYSLLGGVTSGVSSTTFVRQAYSCNGLLGTTPVTSQITWNTGETSVFRQTQVSSNVQGTAVVITQVGSVLSGKFEGATLIRTVTLLASDLTACDSPEGLSSTTGPATLTLLGLLWA